MVSFSSSLCLQALSNSPSSHKVVVDPSVVVGSGVVGMQVGGVHIPEEKVPVSPNN